MEGLFQPKTPEDEAFKNAGITGFSSNEVSAAAEQKQAGPNENSSPENPDQNEERLTDDLETNGISDIHHENVSRSPEDTKPTTEPPHNDNVEARTRVFELSPDGEIVGGDAEKKDLDAAREIRPIPSSFGNAGDIEKQQITSEGAFSFTETETPAPEVIEGGNKPFDLNEWEEDPQSTNTQTAEKQNLGTATEKKPETAGEDINAQNKTPEQSTENTNTEEKNAVDRIRDEIKELNKRFNTAPRKEAEEIEKSILEKENKIRTVQTLEKLIREKEEELRRAEQQKNGSDGGTENEKETGEPTENEPDGSDTKEPEETKEKPTEAERAKQHQEALVAELSALEGKRDRKSQEKREVLQTRIEALNDTERDLIDQEIFENITFEAPDGKKIGWKDLDAGRRALVMQNAEQFFAHEIRKGAHAKDLEWEAQSGGMQKLKHSLRAVLTFRMNRRAMHRADFEKELAQSMLSGESDDLAKQEPFLQQLMKNAYAGPDVAHDEKTGELTLGYVSSRDLPEGKEALTETVNRAANELARLPHEWERNTKDLSKKEQRDLIEKQSSYNNARRKLLESAGEDPETQKKVFSMVNSMDERVTVNRLLNAHPDAEKYLMNTKDGSAWLRGAKEFWKTNGAFVAYGAGVRAATVAIIPAVPIPYWVFGVGYGVGRMIGKKEAGADMALRRTQAGESTFASTEEGKEEEKASRENITYQTKNGEEKTRKIKEFTDSAFFTQRLSRLHGELEKLDEAPDNAERRQELTEKITQTTALAQEKLNRGMIRFGDETHRAENMINFAQKLSLGATHTDQETLKETREKVNTMVSQHESTIDDARKKEISRVANRVGMARGIFGAAGFMLVDWLSPKVANAAENITQKAENGGTSVSWSESEPKEDQPSSAASLEAERSIEKFPEKHEDVETDDLADLEEGIPLGDISSDTQTESSSEEVVPSKEPVKENTDTIKEGAEKGVSREETAPNDTPAPSADENTPKTSSTEQPVRGIETTPETYSIQEGDTLTSIIRERFPKIQELPDDTAQNNAIENIIAKMRKNPEYYGIKSGDVNELFPGDALDMERIRGVLETEKIPTRNGEMHILERARELSDKRNTTGEQSPGERFSYDALFSDEQNTEKKPDVWEKTLFSGKEELERPEAGKAAEHTETTPNYTERPKEVRTAAYNQFHKTMAEKFGSGDHFAFWNSSWGSAGRQTVEEVMKDPIWNPNAPESTKHLSPLYRIHREEGRVLVEFIKEAQRVGIEPEEGEKVLPFVKRALSDRDFDMEKIFAAAENNTQRETEIAASSTPKNTPTETATETKPQSKETTAQTAAQTAPNTASSQPSAPPKETTVNMAANGSGGTAEAAVQTVENQEAAEIATQAQQIAREVIPPNVADERVLANFWKQFADMDAGRAFREREWSPRGTGPKEIVFGARAHVLGKGIEIGNTASLNTPHSVFFNVGQVIQERMQYLAAAHGFVPAKGETLSEYFVRAEQAKYGDELRQSPFGSTRNVETMQTMRPGNVHPAHTVHTAERSSRSVGPFRSESYSGTRTTTYPQNQHQNQNRLFNGRYHNPYNAYPATPRSTNGQFVDARYNNPHMQNGTRTYTWGAGRRGSWY